jgi:hypothetical protein
MLRCYNVSSQSPTHVLVFEQVAVQQIVFRDSDYQNINTRLAFAAGGFSVAAFGAIVAYAYFMLYRSYPSAADMLEDVTPVNMIKANAESDHVLPQSQQLPYMK